MHVTPVFGRSQTDPGFVCGFLREDAEIRECEPTPRLVCMGGQHRNQTSIARKTLSIFRPDICIAFSGHKNSGVGIELGEDGLKEFCNVQVIANSR